MDSKGRVHQSQKTLNREEGLLRMDVKYCHKGVVSQTLSSIVYAQGASHNLQHLWVEL